MRVFIGLVEVAGRNGALKRGFEELGHRATFINLSTNPFNYEGEDSPFLVGVIRRLATLRQRTAPRVLRPFLVIPERLCRVTLFLLVLVSHDVFIYCSASSFFRYWDYRLLSPLAFWDYRLIRLFGKTLICQFQGSDSRPPYLNGAYATQADFSVANCARDTAAKKRGLQVVGRWANAIIDIPPQGYFHEQPYYLGLSVGFPSGPIDATRPSPEAYPDSAPQPLPVRVLHAPSQGRYKGTSEIREIVQGLRAKGLPIEFVEVQGKSNLEVIAEIRKADLVVDQLYCDYALNALPAEALWLGKPVLSSGYSSDLWAGLIPKEFLPPVVYCHPSEFARQLERLVVDGHLRGRLGLAGYDYIRRFHHPRIVAENYLKIVSGAAPAAWSFDPREMKEIWGGFFMPEARARRITGEMVRSYGRESLQLSDKPQLEERLIHWALFDRA